MERFVRSLYDRLEGRTEEQHRLIGIMDGAINEMHNCGILSRLSEDLQKAVHSDDPAERIAAKTAIAKDIAVQNFILSSVPMTLKTGEIAHRTTVKLDPRFINSIALCIQGGLEGLYLSGLYKHCTDEIMHYYIQTDATGDDLFAFRKKLLELESLYENFQIDLMPSMNSPAASAGTTASTPPANAEGGKKKGFWRTLFGKK